MKTDQTYRCRIAIIPEKEGDFSAIVLNLPGTGSCGATEVEAIENCEAAVRASIASYVESGQPIPWTTDHKDPANAKCEWISVDA
jgi:predicted RNase H-like HicB family nuclease